MRNEPTTKVLERQIYASMETGNYAAADTLLNELEDHDPVFTKALRMSLKEVYA